METRLISRLRSLPEELRRRNVTRVALLYAVSSWFVLQVADVLVDVLGLPDWSLRFVLLILVLGLPIALGVSWIYELTPEGLKLDSDLDRDRPLDPQAGRRINLLIIVLLLAAVGFLTLDRFLLEETPVASTGAAPAAGAAAIDLTSIAVLPFVNLSGDPANEYFSDGLSEELLNVLSQIKGLRVAARTSSFRFKNHTGSVAEIGRQLNVGTLLEGSVRKAGNRVRVTAQLIDARNGFHLWSEAYDRELTDIFSIQDDIASEVVAALKVTLLGSRLDEISAAGRTSNVDAHDAYLLARQFRARESYESLERAVTEYERALSLDPNYLDAWIGLVETYQSQALTGAITYDEAIDKGEQALARIRSLDAETERHRGVILALEAGQDMLDLLRLTPSFEAAKPMIDSVESKFRRALQSSPNYIQSYAGLATILVADNRQQEALEVALAGRALDPLSVDLTQTIIGIYQTEGRNQDALREAARLRDIDPSNPDGYSKAAAIHAAMGQLVDAIAFTEQARQVDPDDHELGVIQVQRYLALLDEQRAEEMLELSLDMAPDKPATLGAQVLMQLYRGNYEQAETMARRYLDRNLDNRVGSYFFFNAALVLSSVRDGRYQPVLDWTATVAPSMLENDPSVVAYGPHNLALNLTIPTLRVLGQADRAEALLAAVETCLWECPGYRPLDATLSDDFLLQFLSGSNEAALAALERYADEAPITVNWWISLERNPFLDEFMRQDRARAALGRLHERAFALRSELDRRLANRSLSPAAAPNSEMRSVPN